MNKRASISAGLRADASGWKKGCDTARAETMKFKRDVEAVKVNGPGVNWGKMAAGAATAGAAVMTYVYKSATTVEQLERGLLSVSDGTEKVEDQMKSLAKLSESPGMSMSEAGSASVALQSMGLSAKESREYIAEWANTVAASGQGAEQFGGVMRAVGQMLSKTTIQQEELNQIREQQVNIGPLISGLDDKKNNPREFLDAVLDRMKKMPRVAAGAAESVDNMRDALSQRSGSGIGKTIFHGLAAGVDFLSDSIKMNGNAIENWKKNAEADAGSGVKELSPKEIEDRQAAKVNASLEKELSKRRAINKELQKKGDDEATQAKIAREREAGNEAGARTMEDAVTLAKERAELEKDGLKMADDQVDTLKKQIELRRQDAELLKQMQAQKDKAKADKELDAAGMRHRGKNRKADKADDAAEVERLVADKLPRDVAEDLVRRQRDQANDEKLGPGRRRIRSLRGKPGGPKVPTDRLAPDVPADVMPLPIQRVPGKGTEPAAKAESSGTGGDAAISVLKQIARNTEKTAAEQQQPAKRS